MNFSRKICEFLRDEYNTNTVLNYFFLAIGMLLYFFLVRMSIDYMGVSMYGIWSVVLSVVSWMNSGDLGIGNSLRNELASAYGKGDLCKFPQLIQAAFKELSKVAVLLFFLFLLIAEILIRLGIITKDIRMPLMVSGFFFCLNLITGLSKFIAHSIKKTWMTYATSAFSMFLNVLVLFFLGFFSVKPDLTLYAFVNGVCVSVANISLVWAVIEFNKGIRLFNGDNGTDQEVHKKILNTGIWFGGIQICGIVLYSTDNLIVYYLFDSTSVAKYSVITQFYEGGSTIFGVFTAALWSFVTFYAAKGDYCWINKRIKKILWFWMVYSVGVLSVSLLFKQIVYIWIGNEEIVYDNTMILVFMVYNIVYAFATVFVSVVNGLGAIKFEFCLAVVEAVVNIPLSFLFASKVGMGIMGVKLATLVCLTMSVILMTTKAVFLLRVGSKVEVKGENR